MGEFADKNKQIKFNFYKHFEPEDYLKIINGSACLIGNSSSGIRESSYLGVPVVNIGNRQIHRERAKNVIDVKENYLKIRDAIYKQISKRSIIKVFFMVMEIRKKMVKILEKIIPTSDKNLFGIK